MATIEDTTTNNNIQDWLAHPIILAERVRSVLQEAESFKFECTELSKLIDCLSQMLRQLVRLSASATSPPLYDRPVRRVTAELSKNLSRALTLARKCKRQNLLRRLVTITSATDFRKIFSVLEASIGDIKWVLSIFDFESGNGGNGIVLSLPPIASNDPILAWVWSFIASIQMGQLNDQIEATNELASLAEDNDRNKKIIVEEGGVLPLLKLLKECVSPEGQVAAATALCQLANDQERVRVISDELGVKVVVQVLGDSPVRVQIKVAELVGRMAEMDSDVKEELARENVIRPLVTLLSIEGLVDDGAGRTGLQTVSIHSLVKINKEVERKALNRPTSKLYNNCYSSSSWDGSIKGGNYRKERENEKPEVKLKLKINCSRALWMLASGSVENSRRITETKGLLCLSKMVEKEQGELQYNCLMTIMEITTAAELNSDLRRAAFKSNSPAAKAVVEQLFRVIRDFNDPSLQIPAIKSIGSLARTFPARDTRVIGPLVTQLSHSDPNVATEAAIALGKFACPDNFLCAEHSKAIIESNAVSPLLRLLRGEEWTKLHGLILLCYLALHASNSEDLGQARVLTALEGADRTVIAQYPELRELVSKAIYHLNLYNTSVHSQRFSFVS